MGRRRVGYLKTRNKDALALLSASISGLSEQEIQKAMRRAQVSMYRTGVAMINQDVRGRYGIKLSALRDRYRIKAGTDKRKNKGGDYISVLATARRINLLEFNGAWRRPKGDNTKRQRSKGASATVAAGQRKTYPGAFIASIGWRGVSGASVKQDTVRRGIYVRRRDFSKGGEKRFGRGPVMLLHGPSALEMLLGEDGRYMGKMWDKFRGLYAAELDRQIKLLLKR